VNTPRPELRTAVGERDGWRCRYCGRQLVPPPRGRSHTHKEAARIATLDHWVPKALGGDWELSNLVLSCRACNGDKGQLTGPEYLAVLAYRARAVAGVAGPQRPCLLGKRPATVAGHRCRTRTRPQLGPGPGRDASGTHTGPGPARSRTAAQADLGTVPDQNTTRAGDRPGPADRLHDRSCGHAR
jgi:HNH endonuclease